MVNNDKPLISFVIVAYKQERFIAEAVMGAFSQTYSPLQIILSDDCSPDRTYDIIEQIVKEYTGPHKVILNRTPHNLGLSGHINEVVKLATGELIVAAAGDDISLPERVEYVVRAYLQSNREGKSIYSNAIIIDSNGQREGLYLGPSIPLSTSLLDIAKQSGGVLGCTHAWHKDVFDLWGPMDSEVTREDAVIPFRSALLGKVIYINVPLVLYRRHDNNIHFKNAKDIQNAQEYFQLIARHLDGNIAVFKNRLADLAYFCHIYPEREEDLSIIRLESEQLLKDYQRERDIILESRFVAKISLIISALMTKTPLRRTVRWALIAFTPMLYLILQNYRTQWTRYRIVYAQSTEVA